MKPDGTDVKVFPCPRCQADWYLEEIACVVCGYRFPIEDSEEGLEEYENEEE